MSISLDKERLSCESNSETKRTCRVMKKWQLNEVLFGLKQSVLCKLKKPLVHTYLVERRGHDGGGGGVVPVNTD